MGKWWIALAGGLGILLFLPAIFAGVREGWKGPLYLLPGIPLALLLVGLGIAGSWSRAATAPKPGAPAPFGGLPYGLARTAEGGSYMQRLRAATPHLQKLHRAVLWSPLVAVGAAALLVLPAILFGAKGVEAVGSGMGVMVGALFLLAAYAIGAYRALVPTAVAVALWGLLIEVQAVADAWGWARSWDAWALLLMVPIIPVQALAAEAAFSARPRVFWTVWTAVGTALGVAYPVWQFFGEPGSGDVPLAMTLASLVWGVAANFAFAPVPRPLRWAGVGVFALWSATLLYGYAAHHELGDRAKAAGLVAAGAITAIAFVGHFLAKATGRPQEGPAGQA